jgi:hypothetical protein
MFETKFRLKKFGRIFFCFLFLKFGIVFMLGKRNICFARKQIPVLKILVERILSILNIILRIRIFISLRNFSKIEYKICS